MFKGVFNVLRGSVQLGYFSLFPFRVFSRFRIPIPFFDTHWTNFLHFFRIVLGIGWNIFYFLFESSLIPAWLDSKFKEKISRPNLFLIFFLIFVLKKQKKQKNLSILFKKVERNAEWDFALVTEPTYNNI
jgi:hypothetical protein